MKLEKDAAGLNLQTAGFGAVATFELGVPARDACAS